jgi:hypothetical protein
MRPGGLVASWVWWTRHRSSLVGGVAAHRRLTPVLHVLQAESTIMLVVQLALLVVKLFAFVNSLLYPAEAYDAANKLTKPAWAIGLGLGLVVHLVIPDVFIANVAFTIAAFVYLADVRPALASLTRR